MHSATALLPLLAFNATVLAAPAPLHSVARGVPNVHEVIRNPAPVDDRCLLGLNLEILKALGLCSPKFHGRAAPAVEEEAVAVVPVVGRTLSVEFDA